MSSSKKLRVLRTLAKRAFVPAGAEMQAAMAPPGAMAAGGAPPAAAGIPPEAMAAAAQMAQAQAAAQPPVGQQVTVNLDDLRQVLAEAVQQLAPGRGAGKDTRLSRLEEEVEQLKAAVVAIAEKLGMVPNAPQNPGPGPVAGA